MNEEFLLFATLYGIDKQPNFEGRAWNPHRYDSWKSVVFRVGMEPAQAKRPARLGESKTVRRAGKARQARTRRQDSCLLEWTCHQRHGAGPGAALGRQDYLDAAAQAIDFVRTQMVDEASGRLYATHAAGRARFLGYLDDYAILSDALLAFLEHRWSDELFAFTRSLADRVLAEFEDAEEGGYFFISSEHEPLIHTPKPAIDEAVPASNGILCLVLLKLSELTHEPRYREAAERILRWATPDLQRMPSAHASLLAGLHAYALGLETCILRGDQESLADWRAACHQGYVPAQAMLRDPLGELRTRLATEGRRNW